MFKNFKAVFKSRNASLMLLASIASMFGDWAYFIALSVHLANEKSMGVLATITTVRFACVFALGPLAGAIVERWPKKATMIVSDVVRLVLMIALGFAMKFEPDNLLLIAILAILSSVVGTVFTPARRSLLPLTVTDESRLALNAIDGSIGTVTLMLAPALAGILLVWLSPTGVVFLNGTSFLLSALFLFQLNSLLEEAPAVQDTKQSFIKDLQLGILYIFRSRDVFAITLLGFTSHVAVGATWIFVPLISMKLGLEASGTGYVASAIGLGSVVGMFLGGVTRKHSEVRMAFFAVLAFTLSVCLWSVLYSTIVGAFAGALVMGLTANLFEAPCWSLLQSKTDKSFYARVFSGFDAFTLLGLALGTQVAAVASNNLPLSGAILVIGLLMATVYLVNLIIFLRGEK